jgi:predicted lipoprotein with Yx(FWY)xxD motif
MHRRRLLTALSAGATAALAGCTSGPAGGQETTASPTTTAKTDATVRVRSTDAYGDMLVDTAGSSLYLFQQDDSGESTCYDDCAQNWPPLTVDGEPTRGAAVAASLETIERDDGNTQVTAAGWPLYYYAGDSEPGDTTGQGVGDVWWLVATDGSAVTGETQATTTDDDGIY